MAALRDTCWCLAFAALAVTPWWLRPADPALHARPEVAARPAPVLRELTDLRVPARDGLPAWRAATAQPRPWEGLGGFALGGTLDALELRDVTVSLGTDGVVLAAERGVATRVALELAGVRGRGPAGERLRAGDCVLRGGIASFTGAVAWLAPGDGVPVDVQLDQTLPLAELAARLAKP
ncbi:MAG: hypothetical protein IPM29_17535 [Planctomycetes bacterium]|nr:hypothetical protein [Planctomycetota bacterium]